MNTKKQTNGNTSGNGVIIDADTVANLENLDAETEAEELDAELVGAVESEKKTEDSKAANDAENAKKAAMMVAVIESLLKSKWPFLIIDSNVRVEVCGKLLPVFNKYGDGFPPWLAEWREEIELGIVLSVAGFGIHSQIAARSEKNQHNEPTDNEQKEEYPPQPTNNNGLQ